MRYLIAVAVVGALLAGWPAMSSAGTRPCEILPDAASRLVCEGSATFRLVTGRCQEELTAVQTAQASWWRRQEKVKQAQNAVAQCLLVTLTDLAAIAQENAQPWREALTRVRAVCTQMEVNRILQQVGQMAEQTEQLEQIQRQLSDMTYILQTRPR